MISNKHISVGRYRLWGQVNGVILGLGFRIEVSCDFYDICWILLKKCVGIVYN